MKAESYTPDLPFDGSDIFPNTCHSHNDYWRPHPVYTALENGCSALEADVWLSTNAEVLVGHTPGSLTADSTLSTLYIDPILDILEQNNPPAVERETTSLNGVFKTAPQTTLVLLLDFKSDGDDLWAVVSAQLDPLRTKGYLTHFNGSSMTRGPVTVVVSGNAPFSKVLENPQYLDMFFDAPLESLTPRPVVQMKSRQLHKTSSTSTPSIPPSTPSYNATNSFYASASFPSSIGHPIPSSLSHTQLSLLRAQIRSTHAHGLKVRYWGVPAWPVGVRNYLWRVMVREGVDYVSVDDVTAFAEDDWRPRKGGWGRRGSG